MTYTRAQAYALYKNDYLYHDGVETVTFTALDGTTVATVKAKQELPQTSPLEEYGDEGGDSDETCKWVVWDTTLSGQIPVEGCSLTTSGSVVWRMTGGISRELWDTQWHCECKKDR